MLENFKIVWNGPYRWECFSGAMTILACAAVLWWLIPKLVVTVKEIFKPSAPPELRMGRAPESEWFGRMLDNHQVRSVRSGYRIHDNKPGEIKPAGKR